MPSKKRESRTVTFEQYYSGVYGHRWPTLRRAMVAPSVKVALWNRFCQIPFAEVTQGMRRVDDASTLQLFRPARKEVSVELNNSHPETNTNAHTMESMQQLDKPPMDEFNIKAYYLLDYVSALIVEQLDVSAFDKVLDMCAAPGGKTIAIAQFLSPDGSLTTNEQRADRCARLRRNLKEYVPSNYVPIEVTQRDATTWYAPSTFHRVLVDAPCSSERHLLQQSRGAPVAAAEWTLRTTSERSRLQTTLLLRALETCRPGGRVVYSTCSISPMENDGVVDEALRRTRCQVELRATSLRVGEKTRRGHIVLPDTADGWGPLYCTVFHKISDHRMDSSEDDDEDEDDDDDDEKSEAES